MKQQSVKVRRKRLAEGCCPTHGLLMPQIGVWYKLESGRHYTIVGCPRNGCRIRARDYSVNGPWELMRFNEQPEGERI